MKTLLFHGHRILWMTNLFLIGLLQNKILEELDDVVFSNDDIDLPDIDSGIVTFFSNEMGVITTDFDNINLDDDHFDEDDPETIIHVRLVA